MPAYKDGKKWRIVYSYKENGKLKQSQKRGFSTKREALEWEREFLLESTFSMKMKFKSLYKLYMKDIKPRIKEITYLNKKSKFENRILPYLKDYEVSDITPVTIREFQNHLITSINEKTGKVYSSYYVKMINSQLVALFNYAVNYHDLKENPCLKAGQLKLKYNKKMEIWTVEEFKSFVMLIEHKHISYTGFNLLFWCGMRVGEMLALTRRDIDLEKRTIDINKTYRRMGNRDIVTSTKTDSSNRVISIPDRLVTILNEYFEKIYNLEEEDRVFNTTRYMFRDDMKRYSPKANIKRIRLHDLRHSHASLLINAGVNPLAISKRLGHARVDMTLNIYSHLYPSYDEKMLEILDNV